MKVLIVDDEAHVREAITLLIEWDNYEPIEVLEASNGREAVAMIERHAPQIVLTDMIMPAGGGIDLLQWISLHCPDTRTLVISGHGDFDFARQTLRYGGMDYLLKPIDTDQLNESFARAVESWKISEANRQRILAQAMEVNRFKPVYRDKLCSDLLGAPSARQTAERELAGEFGITGAVGTVRSAVVRFSEQSRLWHKYAGRTELLFFTLANVANELLRRGKDGYAFRNLGREREIVIFFWNGAAHANEKLNKINAGLAAVLGEPLHFGIGACAEGLGDGLRASYLQAEEALKKYAAPTAVSIPTADNASRQDQAQAVRSIGSDPRTDTYSEAYVHPFETGTVGGAGVMEEIASYIREHYQEELTLQDLADRFFLSREYISRRFKREFGENVFDYLANIRLERAKRLLLGSEMTVVRIAELVGYQDEKYFSRVFKKSTGCTPNEFRRASLGKDFS
ncbi:helix-turn-helix domain-containing protein [Saccharibacillus sp. JS10]|uniref:helix-turn-helix domain-containing protein n=1 Tax=Saccharibacillus sp. JS10 TaxID=2950552 RepID=UPI00210C253D|nr:helix-turn-helix domain-containing protein [Saccharibacillus sp. JS10]MCQ4087599.1 response regulator [Saccharibacillus sp. JS10]